MDETTLKEKTKSSEYVRLLDMLLAHPRPYSYTYMDSADYAAVADLTARSRIYWFEIVERAHCASYLALIRTDRWWQAMVRSAQARNYISFAASFRGLLESAADIRHALGEVPRALAIQFPFIQRAMDGVPGVMALAPSLEDTLIHFSHARKLGKGESAPDSHSAKLMKTYLDSLEGGPTGPMHDAYAALCNVTHPAAESVLYLLEPRADGAITFSTTPDEEAITDLCDGGGTVAAFSLSESLLYPVLILKVVERLKVEGLDAPSVASIELPTSTIWQEIEPLLTGR